MCGQVKSSPMRSGLSILVLHVLRGKRDCEMFMKKGVP
jgi:hypothetical protein